MKQAYSIYENKIKTNYSLKIQDFSFGFKYKL